MNKVNKSSEIERKTSIFSVITTVFIVLLFTVFLFAINGNGFSGILEVKFRFFRYICCGYVICIVLLTAEELIVSDIRFSDITGAIKCLSTAQWLVIAYMLLTLLSAVLSENREYTWIGASTRTEGALSICTYCMCFLFVSMFGEVKKWMPYLLGASVLAFSVICIIQLCGGNPFGFYPEGLNYFDKDIAYSGAYLGTLGNVDILAGFLCISIPLLTVSVIRMEGKLKFILLLPIAASLFVLVKMFVLAGFMGVFGACVLMLPVILPCKLRTRKIIAILLLLCIIASVGVLYAADIGNGLFHEIHALLHGDADDSFGTGRMYIWRQVLSRVPEHLLFGAGPDTMILDDIPPFERYDAERDMMHTSYISAAHNEYLNVLYHQGIFALAAYMAVLVLIAVKWIKCADESSAAAACGAGALGYCIQAFFGISMCLVAPFFWVTLALTEKSSKQEKCIRNTLNKKEWKNK